MHVCLFGVCKSVCMSFCSRLLIAFTRFPLCLYTKTRAHTHACTRAPAVLSHNVASVVLTSRARFLHPLRLNTHYVYKLVRAFPLRLASQPARQRYRNGTCTRSLFIPDVLRVLFRLLRSFCSSSLSISLFLVRARS